MKIAFINKYQNSVFRGAETFVSELSKRLSKNHEVDVLTLLPLGKRYDIIIPTNGRFQVIAARLLSWATGAKMIVSGQSGAGLDDRINLYSFPDAFIALSEYQKNWAEKVNPFVKVLKIPNGVTLHGLLPKGGSGNNTIISVGAFTDEKRHDLTIIAVSKLKGIPRLLIVGGGGDKKSEIERLGKNLLGSRFEIKSVPHSEINSLYKKASILAFPSVPWESFGIVLVEAMAAGLPVVATDDPIRREIVGDAGILVDPTDTEKYSLSLRKALETNLGDKPRKQAEKFDWDKIAIAYEELFKTLQK